MADEKGTRANETRRTQSSLCLSDYPERTHLNSGQDALWEFVCGTRIVTLSRRVTRVG
jgi:hypothetical protein